MFTLRLELIGDCYLAYAKAVQDGRIQYPKWRDELNAIRYGRKELRPWVARITGLDSKYGFRREFMSGPRDYTHADNLGKYGIYEYYYLEDGLYEINEAVALGKARRYFVQIIEEWLNPITREEVIACLNDTLA